MKPSMNVSRKSTLETIVFAGLLTGTLDISAALIDYYIQSGKGPAGVLKFIAGGIFGETAFSGGMGMILAGLFCHYLVAFCFTIFFWWLYPRAKFIRFNIFLTAILYGIFIWVVMNLIVLPLSNLPKHPLHLPKSPKPVIILICMIGLPLAIIMKRFYRKKSNTVLGEDSL